jgi:hypothetical protein
MLGDKQKSETWARSMALRYDGLVFEWYFWCRRNASGDLDAARERVLEIIDAAGEGPYPGAFPISIAVFKMLENKNQEAFKLLNETYEESKDPSVGLYAVTAAGVLGDRESQNRLLLEIFQQGSTPAEAKERPGHVKLASLLLSDLLKAKTGSPLEGERLERFISDHSPNETVNLNYFIGMWLIQQGKTAEGIRCLTAAATAHELRLSRYLAAAYLHEKDVDF